MTIHSGLGKKLPKTIRLMSNWQNSSTKTINNSSTKTINNSSTKTINNSSTKTINNQSTKTINNQSTKTINNPYQKLPIPNSKTLSPKQSWSMSMSKSINETLILLSILTPIMSSYLLIIEILISIVPKHSTVRNSITKPSINYHLINRSWLHSITLD